MSTCYWCCWGWPKPIKEIFDRAIADLNALEDSRGADALAYGPAHIVWADENWDAAQHCLDGFDSSCRAWGLDPKSEELVIVRRSLEELLKVPDEFKYPPAGYDGEHPENFPPPENWGIKRR